jgi:hypothetical protein
VYVTSGSGAEESNASPPAQTTTGGVKGESASSTALRALIPAPIWQACQVQTVAQPNADETAWEHRPGKPGGRVFCYFDGDDAVIVWTHERLSQATHHDMLAIAREGGSDHARLTRWWRPWHHLIGKSQQ